jgi:hypothetical protein
VFTIVVFVLFSGLCVWAIMDHMTVPKYQKVGSEPLAISTISRLQSVLAAHLTSECKSSAMAEHSSPNHQPFADRETKSGPESSAYG